MGRARRISEATALLLVAALAQGCSGPLLLNGGLYSHTTEPLTFNRSPTLVRQSERLAKGKVTELHYPLTGLLGVRVGNNGIGEVAKEHGITTVYYADLEHRSALFGLWTADTIHIYGK